MNIKLWNMFYTTIFIVLHVSKTQSRVIIYIGEFSLKQNLPSNLVFKVAKQLYIEADSLYIETDTSTKF